jgi:hypothetical protein
MQILLYCPSPQAKDTIVPVLEFFASRYRSMNHSQTVEDLSGILSKWKHVKDNNGQADGWYAKKQHDLDYIEIHVKKSNVLLRFPYYLDSINNKMIILIGYDKIDGHKSGGKEDRKVKKNRLLAQSYYDDYHKDHSKEVELPEYINNLMK